jgi:hypothetical protein
VAPQIRLEAVGMRRPDPVAAVAGSTGSDDFVSGGGRQGNMGAQTGFPLPRQLDP